MLRKRNKNLKVMSQGLLKSLKLLSTEALIPVAVAAVVGGLLPALAVGMT